MNVSGSNNKILLSIIVPFYGVEDYIAACLESIVGQPGFDQYCEVIAVNDGTKDQSREIVEKYASSYVNLKIIDQENQGLGGARNRGLREAAGEFVWFVDSDDFIFNNSISQIVQLLLAEVKLDVLTFRLCKSDEQGRVARKPFLNCKFKSYNSRDFFLKHRSIAPMSVLYICRRDFLVVNDLHFTDGIMFEDEEFTLKTLSLAGVIVKWNALLYCYRIRAGSIMTSTGNSQKKIISLYTVAYNLKTFVQEHSFSDAVNKYFLRKISQLVILLISLIENDSSLLAEYLPRLYKDGLLPVSSSLILESIRYKLKNRKYINLLRKVSM